MRVKNYRFLGYFGVILVSILFWLSFFTIFYSYKDYEQVQIFITSHTYYSNIEEQLLKNVNENTLKNIVVTHVSYDDDNYDSALVTVGMLDSDILILPESVLNHHTIEYEFIELSDSYLDIYGIDLSNFELLTISDTVYAIKVYDSETKTSNLNEYVSFSYEDTNDYYILINASSINAGDYGVVEQNTTTNVFKVLKELLNQE